MKELRDKVAVVTGGASGIGLAMARQFAEEGMKVVLADVEEQALAKALAELEDAGADALAVHTDVSNAADMARLREDTLAKYGKVHVVCNNAGVGGGGLLWETTLEDWNWVMGVNLWGVVHGIRTFVPVMLEQGEEGHVVNTASVAGLISPPGIGIYNATKHAVVAISETLHVELMLRGAKVKASVLCPAWVRTNIADADRNRPAALRGDRALSTEEQMMDQVMRQVVATGMDPSEVASHVVDAVRNEKLYILTHPEFEKVIRGHYERMLSGKNPGMEIISHLVPGGAAPTATGG
jgi:NAD(P)-dependent dehydrogenase (short-subunit alcohol dehydrogenase family)